MSSRDAILTALRRNAPPPAPAPEHPEASAYPDPVRQFSETLASVGGRCVSVASVADLESELNQLEVFTKARKVVSLVDGLPAAESACRVLVDTAALEDPHELEGIDLAILPGEFAVAENAAVWIPGSALGRHRAVFVVAQHLILVVAASEVVHNMRQAYERIRFERPGFGLFLSGPSKTADIEQSLVIGAHGARSCTVFLVGQ